TKCDGVKPVCGNCARLHQDCQYIASNKKRGPRQSHIDLLEKRLAKMEAMLNRPSTSEEKENGELISPGPEATNDSEDQPTHSNVRSFAELLPSTAVIDHLVELFSDMPEVKEYPPWQAGEKYASKARQCLANVIDEPCVSNVQGLILLATHEYGCGRGPRMALQVDLHRETAMEKPGADMILVEDWIDAEVRRKVFWELFLQDKFASAATGRPTCIQEEDCKLFLPSEDDSHLTKDHFCAVSIDGNTTVRYEVQKGEDGNTLGLKASRVDTSQGVVSLTPIWRQLGWPAHIFWETSLLGKVTQFVNRSKKSEDTYTPDDPNSEFVALDRQIDDWGKRLPLHMRNTPANLERHRSLVSYDSSRFVLAHVLHNALIVLLHRPALVLAESLSKEGGPSDKIDYILNSVDKCMTAADNVTVMLKSINSRRELLPPFLTYLAYIMATIVVNNSFSPKREEAQKAQMALAEHFRLLQAMRSHWAMADKLYFMIRDLYAMHKNVMRKIVCKEGVPGHVKKANHNQASVTLPTNNTPSSLASGNTNFGNTGNQVHTASFEPSNPENEPSLAPPMVRKIPLAGLSLSTSDWASLTDWQQGEYQESMIATRQTIERTIGPNQYFQAPLRLENFGSFDTLGLELDPFDTNPLPSNQVADSTFGT
ncbi:hypothetical protein EC973_001836, partial [Apophysomyces ossiformis]